MDTKIEIYFSDLSEEKQNELLEAYDVKNPKELNWHITPVFTFVIESDQVHSFIIHHP